MKKHIYTFLTLFLSYTSVFAAELNCNVHHYSTEDGLPQYIIMDILQDQKGCMWFATWDGLSKFDGYKFHNYKAQPGDWYLMKSNRIEKFYEDRYGRIWLQSYDDEAHCFNPKTEKFWGFQSVAGYENYPFKLSKIQVNQSGKVWLLSPQNGCIEIIDSLFNIQAFSIEKGNLKGKSVHSVFEDKAGNSWLLTDNGLSLIQKGKEKVVHFFYENNQLKNQYLQNFHCAHELRTEIWFGSDKGRIWQYSKTSGNFRLMQLPANSDIIEIKQISQNQLYIITSGNGFFLYNTENDQFKLYNSSVLPELKTNTIISTYLDKSKRLWIETDKVGVFKFDLNTQKIRYFYVNNDDASTVTFPPRFFVLEDVNHRTWIQPKGGGFSLYNPQTDQFESLLSSDLNQNIRYSNILHTAYSDRQGTLWLCSRANGLDKIVFGKSYFKTQLINLNAKTSVSNDVRTVFEDSKLNLWIATKDGRLTVYDKNKKFIGRLSYSGSLTQDAALQVGVYSMIQDKAGNIWIGTKGEGILKLSPTSNRQNYRVEQFKKNPSDVYSLSDNNIYSIFQDKSGNIWIGTYGGGINLVRNAGEGKIYFINYRNNLKNYPIDLNFRVRYITQDQFSNICVGTTAGLVMFSSKFSSPEKIRFRLYTRMPGEKESLNSNDIHGICITRKGEMYIATFGGGVSKVTEKDKNGFPLRFKAYTNKSGLPSDITLAIQEDETGKLWITSENNLTEFDPEKEVFENFAEIKRLMTTNYFSEASTCRLHGNQLVFGYSNGILYFNPGHISNNNYKPQVVFSNFQLFNKEVQINENSPLKTSIDNLKVLKLKHNLNFFSIEYAALDFVDPDNILYAYKLDGFDKDWNYVQKQRIANYTNLPKGKYTFRVKSTNSEGVWVENERQLLIEVLPSFWETIWAYLLYILLFAGLIYLIVYILLKIYKLEGNVELEKQLAEMKLRFFTDISHEIRTPLTMITAPVDYMLNDKKTPEDMKKQLKMISQSTNRMLRLVNQILDFRKIQFLHLKVQETEIAPFVEEICDNFSEIADKQHIKFRFINHVDSEKIWVDQDCLEKIVMNLLSNAFKFTPPGKSIQVEIKSDDKTVSIEVRDQGSGVSKEKQKNLFVRFASFNEDKSKPSTGIGLSMIKDLADKHSAKVTVESEIGKGSCFAVSFLKGITHFDKSVEIIVSTDTEAKQPDDLQTIENQRNNPSTDIINIEKHEGIQSVLIVEDDADLRSFMKDILKDDYHIYEAEDGQDGLEKAEKYCPDFIVSDIMMPRLDGIELLQILKKTLNTSHIPVVLLTAKTTIESKLEGLSYGADDYITKPFSVPYFRARIANLLQQRKQLQEIYCNSLNPTTGDLVAPHDFNPQPISITSQDEEMMKKIMHLIEENMENSEFSVEELGQYVGMSRSVFFKKLKSLTGLAPVEFIRDVKMKRAAQILSSGQFMVKEVSYMVGISDTKYFAKCFKTKYGVTPLEYKNKTSKE